MSIDGATLLLVLVAATTVMGVGLLTAWAFARPHAVAALVLAATILIPVELAVQRPPFPRVGPTRLLLITFVVGVLLRAVAMRLQLRWVRPRLARPPLLRVWLVYLCVAVASCAFSVDRLGSVYSVANQVGPQFLMFVLLAAWLEDPAFWPQLKRVLFVAAALVCAYSYYEVLSGTNPLIQLYPDEAPLYRGGALRVRSTFFHPIALGCFVSLVFPFVLVDILGARNLGKRLGAAALGLALVTTAALTISRAPLAALAFETGLVGFWWARGRRAKLGLLASALGALLLVGAFVYSSRELLRPFLNPSEWSAGHQVSEASSEYYRMALLKGVLARLEGARWLVGYGPGTFRDAGVEVTYAGQAHVLTAADSHYLKLLLEYGALGLGGFLLLMSAAVVTCVRGLRRAPPDRQLLAVACLAGVVGFLWENLTVSMFHIYALGMLFWIAVGLAHNLPPHNAVSRGILAREGSVVSVLP